MTDFYLYILFLQIAPDKLIAFGDTQFKLDPLIERNASSPEIWAQQLINIIYSSQISNLILQETNISCLTQITRRKDIQELNQPCTYSDVNTILPECQHIPDTLSK